jgi:hypothetical protein
MLAMPMAFLMIGEHNIYRFLGNNLLIVYTLGVYGPSFGFLTIYIGLIVAFALLTIVLTLSKGTVCLSSNNALLNSDEKRIRLRRLAGAATTGLIFIPPSLTLWDLSRPLVPIDDRLPEPNGRDVLIELGGRYPPQDFDKQIAAGPTYAGEYAELRAALKLPFATPIRSMLQSDEQQKTREWLALRHLAWALQVRAEAALRDRNVDEALACCFDILDLAQSLQRGGLVFDFQSALQAEAFAMRNIYHALPQLNAAQCKTVIARLAEFDRTRVDVEESITRQKNWELREHTWARLVRFRLFELAQTGNVYWEWRRLREVDFPRAQAIARMLIVETAIRDYQRQVGRLPTRLDDLTPTYFARVPVDPFATGNQPLRFSAADDLHSLSSVGPPPPPADSYESRLLFSLRRPPGAFQLEDHFAADSE